MAFRIAYFLPVHHPAIHQDEHQGVEGGAEQNASCEEEISEQ